MLDHLIAYIHWTWPGLALAAAMWAAVYAWDYVRARRRARAVAREFARRIARETALECQAAADLDACHLIWDLDAADAELDRRIERLRDTRKENDQP